MPRECTSSSATRPHGVSRTPRRSSLGFALLLALLPLFGGRGVAGAPTKKPNILFILVDDHDPSLKSTDYMPRLRRHVIDKGVTFDNWAVNTPVCCPSRTTVLTGRYAHNTNLTDVFPPYGGHTALKRNRLDDDYLPTWLAKEGYGTYLVGKFLVEYALYNCQNPPKGWADIDALILPFTFNYTHPVFSRNGKPPNSYPGQYSTDVIREKALAQLRTAAASGKPFFLEVAPIAPHDTVLISRPPSTATTSPGLGAVASALRRTRTLPPVPAPRHAELFKDVQLPIEAIGNFNEADMSDKPQWIRARPALKDADIAVMTEYYRNRLRSLQAVDEMVEALVTELDRLGELDNTFIFYTSDNGYHIGSHRQGAGKESPYEEDVKVPFYVRGPGLKQGVVSHDLGSHVDLAATFVSLAGGAPPPLSDGQPLPLQPVAEQGASFFVPEHPYEFTGVEFWGFHVDQLSSDPFGAGLTNNFTYKTIRAAGPAAAAALGGPMKYTTWCTGERELYDLKRDPWELDNQFRCNAPFVAKAEGQAAAEAVEGVRPQLPGPLPAAAELKRAWDRLDAVLSAFAKCKGPKQCVRPLAHTSAGVDSLAAAMDPSHDTYFSALPKFKWGQCKMYYDSANEAGAFDQQPTASQQGGGQPGAPSIGMRGTEARNGGGGASSSASTAAPTRVWQSLQQAGGGLLNNLFGGRRRRLTGVDLAAAADASKTAMAAVERFAAPVAEGEMRAWQSLKEFVESNRPAMSIFQ